MPLGPDLIEPVGASCCDEDAGEIVSREFVVGSCDAPEVLEPASHALDTVAPVGADVVGIGVFREAVEGMTASAPRWAGSSRRRLAS